MKLKYLQDLNEVEIYNICKRGTSLDFELQNSVSNIIKAVELRGDEALLEFTVRFEKRKPAQLILKESQIKSIANTIPAKVKNAIDIAFDNISKFHQHQLKAEEKIETMPGVLCWREVRAIEKIGLYIPGGSAILPSTLLMLGIPARLANCKEIIVCTPANEQGTIGPEIAYILTRLEIPKVYLCGGAQAIAAMTFGTQSIPKVDKICGPGNAYVTEAKIQLQRYVAIDFPAGPSEVLIIADETANPDYLAADLLAQAEHGADSQAILVCTSLEIIESVQTAIQNQLTPLPRKQIAEAALNNSFILKTTTLDEAISFSNTYAPEHLIICCKESTNIITKIKHAGSVFIGDYSPESAGDYASGTNHTLPTSGFAKAYSGVSVDTFLKKISFQQISPDGLKRIGTSIEILAEIEGLQAHKNAVSIRLESLKNLLN